MKIVAILCVLCILVELGLSRPSEAEKEIEDLLKRILKPKNKHLQKGRKNPLEEDLLDPESPFENDVERQSVDTKKGKFKPKNIHPKKKKELLSQKLDSHPKNPRRGKEPKGDKFNKRISKRNFDVEGSLWTNGIIPYEIIQTSNLHEHIRVSLRAVIASTKTSLLSSLIEDAIGIIESQSCVKWQLRNGEASFVRIVNGGGCSSYIGNINHPSGQPLTLNENGCLYLSTVIHEMLHAMGAQHEQSRLDRMGQVQILWDNIQAGYANNFEVSNTRDVVPYDMGSVMQYSLWAFGVSGKDTMQLRDPSLEYLTTQGGKTLTIYDIAEINNAYQCTDDCSNTCQNGGVVKKSGSLCGCACPSGLKGSDCSVLDTSAGCGGFVDVTAGQSSQITLPNYSNGLECTWLVRGATGTRIKATINSMDLPYSTQNNCYHWIEFRDNLIGLPGKEKCGNAGGSQFLKSLNGNPSAMMIRFNSAKHTVTPGTGFSITVEAYNSGCIGFPCKNGGTCTETANGGFVCQCTNGWSGSTCEHIAADATNKCTLSDDYHTCAFKQEQGVSQFQWLLTPGHSSYLDTDPGLVVRPMQSGTYYYGWKSLLVTNANFEESNRCLSFKYIFPTNNLQDSWPASVNVYYEGDGVSKTTAATLTTAQATASWTQKDIVIPSLANLKITIEGVIGRQKVTLDDLTIKPGTCDSLVPCVDFNPCQNGGVCVPSGSTATCQCNSCMYTGTYCETDLGNGFSCTFEDQNCFLVNDVNDDFDWTIRQYSTPSSNTGPSQAYEGLKYLYIETSSPRVLGDTAILKSNVVFDAKTYCLKLMYHMYDGYLTAMGTLNIKTQEGTNAAVTQFTKTGNQGNEWKSLQLNLNLNPNTKIIIEGIRGASWSGDIAIDDVELHGCAC